jgi:cyclophilin family peptidyl-prolyl cis-trans isomerase
MCCIRATLVTFGYDGRTVRVNGRVAAVNHTLRTSRTLALLAAGLVVLAACGDDSGSSADSTIAPTSSAAAGGTAAAGCAPADGSAAKQQQFNEAPPMCLADGATYTATIETSSGTLHVTLRNDIAPNTVNSFVNLSRYHYFDGTTCHRAIKGFVVQCGDPTATGTGGPGYEFADELGKIEPYQIGSVAMANAGPNTNGSQFFIITGADGAALPPNYTLFGQVIADDMGVVATLDGLANPQDGPPLTPIDITSVTIDEK